MSAGNGCKLWLMIGLVMGGFGLWSGGMTTHGEPQKEKGEEKPAQVNLKRYYYGTSGCSACHSKPDPEKMYHCKCDEFITWGKKDKHKDATRVLLAKKDDKGNEKETLGSRICKLMKIDNVLQEKQCMSCHGVVVKEEKVDKKSFKLEDGVSCVACHGPHDEWKSKHHGDYDDEAMTEWRKLSRKTKQDKFGMYDLWDPAKRAAVCASCHIGNANEGKIVTHEMYAAGHPPLPNLEVATFSEGMPRHWEYMAEKNPKVIETILKYHPKLYTPGELERTELAVISGVVAFRESMKLLQSQATAGNKGQVWPEYAQFDCYACHHDLKSKSWRQQRGYAGKPGRPGMRPWPTALIDLAIKHAAQSDKTLEEEWKNKYAKTMGTLIAAFDAQPFGDSEKVAAAAGQAVEWADKLLPLVRKKSFNTHTAKKLLSALGTLHKNDWLDFDSARQVTWVYKVLLDDVGGKSLWDKDQQGSNLYQTLNTQLQLHLIQGQKEIAKDFLPYYLKAISDYEPEAYRNNFGALTKHFRALSK